MQNVHIMKYVLVTIVHWFLFNLQGVTKWISIYYQCKTSWIFFTYFWFAYHVISFANYLPWNNHIAQQKLGLDYLELRFKMYRVWNIRGKKCQDILYLPSFSVIRVGLFGNVRHWTTSNEVKLHRPFIRKETWWTLFIQGSRGRLQAKS